MTKKIFAPGGVSSVRTYLAVSNVDRQLEFLHQVFDSNINERLKNTENHTVHGELQIGDSIIMIGRITPEVSAIQGMCYVYVENVDVVFQKALQLGAEIISPPADQVYGNREGGFKDAEGNIWWVAQFLKEVSSDELEKEISKIKPS